jgi:hypothetical protein
MGSKSKDSKGYDISHITNMTCPRCTVAGTKICGGCRNIKYCSAECQQADWPTHKVLCSTFKDFTQRPSPNKRRIIAFLPGETKPRFIWATAVGDLYYHTIDAMSIFPTEEPYHEKITIHHNAWTNTGLGYRIKMCFIGYARDHYPGPNKAVVTATDQLSLSGFGFPGPVFAYCGRLGDSWSDAETEHESVTSDDMDMRTYAHLVAYLTYYWNEGFEILQGPKVACVKVACNGDRKNGVPSHQIVHVPRSHPLFLGKGVLSKISKVSLSLCRQNKSKTGSANMVLQGIQEPLITWKCPTSQSPLTNQQITFMHLSCDPDAELDPQNHGSSSFGWAPMLFQSNVGTQLVARVANRKNLLAGASNKHLSVETVQAFGDFCQWHLAPYMQKYGEEGGDDAAAPDSVKPSAHVLSQITNVKWTEYLSQWKAEKEDVTAVEAHGKRAYTSEKANSGLERMGLTEEDSDRICSILCSSHQAHLDSYKSRFEEQ